MLYFQSPGLLVYLVSQPTEVNPLYPLAKLQVGHPEGHTLYATSHYHWIVLLFYAWIHGQENVGGLIFCLLQRMKSQVYAELNYPNVAIHFLIIGN